MILLCIEITAIILLLIHSFIPLAGRYYDVSDVEFEVQLLQRYNFVRVECIDVELKIR